MTINTYAKHLHKNYTPRTMYDNDKTFQSDIKQKLEFFLRRCRVLMMFNCFVEDVSEDGQYAMVGCNAMRKQKPVLCFTEHDVRVRLGLRTSLRIFPLFFKVSLIERFY